MNRNSLDNITPVVLTYNEEPNIARALDSLRWAQKVVVLDSGSTDATESIARAYPNVVWYTRVFDNFMSQWNYALGLLDGGTEYVLGLDADMETTGPLLDEISRAFLSQSFAGGMIPFDYRYYGRSLAGSLCASQLRLFRREQVTVTQLNHGHKFSVLGKIYHFNNQLVHDDRKPIDRWLKSQLQYQLQNEQELATGAGGRLRDRLRNAGVMPPLMGLLAYIKAGGPFKGAAAARYAYERMTTEGILALRLLDSRLRESARTAETKRSTK
jgi:glycosyltransferase involved in cell wall biosynthesis